MDVRCGLFRAPFQAGTTGRDRARAGLRVKGRDEVVSGWGGAVALGVKTGFGVGVCDSCEATRLLAAKNKSAAAMGADAPLVRVPNEPSRFTVLSYFARRTVAARYSP